ncbi:MAG: hydroxyphenylacetyl-CoA thioesterase PaaI [Pseudomonadota bacterium]
METLELARACADKMLADDRASRALGMNVSIPAQGEAVVTMTVRSDMVNGHDICHGGYIFTLADSAFAFACNGYNQVTVAAGAAIDFVRPGKLGDELTATAVEGHRGRRSGLYDVTVTNQDHKLVARFHGRSATVGPELIDPPG